MPAKKRSAPKKKPAKKAKRKAVAVKAKKAAAKAKAKLLGRVTHYYDRIGVAIVELKFPLKIGDAVLFRKGEHELAQTVGSLQIDHRDIAKASKGDVVGLKVDTPVRDGAVVLAA